MSALIAAKPGPLRDALRSFLLVMPQIKTVRQVGDTLALQRAVLEDQPALVLLDTSVFDNGEGPTVIRMSRADGAQSRWLVLANDVHQQREAQSAGADIALLKGFPAAKLFEIIEELLHQPEK